MQPAFVSRSTFEALRGERGFAPTLEGLWSAGDAEVLAHPCVAIVGTRAATPYGRGLARLFARDLGAAGCCIVSGLALGIDAAAHESALDAGAPTVGVLGGGHARFFPRRNRELAERICSAGGAVLSPYEPGAHALPAQFLARNAIVAGLADAVLVVEAPARSGALNTAGHAAGRIPVLAVPGDVDRRSVEGCHALIRDGATLARTPGDVLEAMGLLQTQRKKRRETGARTPRADPLENAVVRALEAGETALDELANALRAPAGAILAALSILELDGAIESRPGHRYALARRRRDAP